MKIKIATFNVNSVKARLENVLAWLKDSAPDIVLLQEIKCVEEDFPFTAFSDLGYNAAVLGQKTYNGVAILSKFRIEDIVKNIPGFEEDLMVKTKAGRKKKAAQNDLFGGDNDDYFSENEDGSNSSVQSQQQARYIEAVIPVNKTAIRVASIYVPNGGGEIAPGESLEESEKFQYKMNFYKALRAHFEEILQYDEIAVFGGDFNVAKQDIDVYDAKSLDGTVCFHPDERKEFRAIENLGLTDSFRAQNPETHGFSWWDYRSGGWQNNKGLRIDYLLTSPLASDKICDVVVCDQGVRDKEKASDHCPVMVEIEV